MHQLRNLSATTTLLALLILGLTPAVDSAPSANSAGSKALSFEQKSDYGGTYLINTSALGTRIKQPSRRLTFLIPIKQSKVCVLNDSLKAYIWVPLSVWKEPYTAGSFLRKEQFYDLKFARSENAIDKKQPCKLNIFEASKKYDKQPSTQEERLTVVRYELTTTAQTIAEPEVWRLLYKLYGIPAFKGMPFKFVYVCRDAKVRNDMHTVSVYETTCSAADFAVPTDFQKKATLLEVYGGQAHSETVKDFFEGF